MKSITKASRINIVTQVIPDKNIIGLQIILEAGRKDFSQIVDRFLTHFLSRSLRSIEIGVRISSIRRAASSWVPGILLHGELSEHSESSDSQGVTRHPPKIRAGDPSHHDRKDPTPSDHAVGSNPKQAKRPRQAKRPAGALNVGGYSYYLPSIMFYDSFVSRLIILAQPDI
jgi:hypothetical protein